MTTNKPETATEPYAVEPDIRDLCYDRHERNVLDYWRPARSAAPLVLHIHGGGFMAGDKSRFRLDMLAPLHAAGWAIASINYRLSHQANSPAFMLDGARSLQFLRSRAGELGFDPDRVALCGSSAGAGISLWVGFHEDLGDARSDDPVGRQSTHVNCIVIRNGQCSYDPRLFKKLGLGAAVEHPFIESFYGLPRSAFDTPQAQAMFDEAAAVTHIKPGAPPVFAYYTGALDPVPDRAPEVASGEINRLPNLAVHHPLLGLYLKEKLESVGTPCTVEAQVKEDPALHGRIMAFLRRYLAEQTQTS